MGKAPEKIILDMVKTVGTPPSAPHPDPEPISTDEFLLRAMESREDAEKGADKFNAETFGESGGWTFEENLAANQALQKNSGVPGDIASPDTALASGCTMLPAAGESKPLQNADIRVSAHEHLPIETLSVDTLVHKSSPPPISAWVQPLSSIVSLQSNKVAMPKPVEPLLQSPVMALRRGCEGPLAAAPPIAASRTAAATNKIPLRNSCKLGKNKIPPGSSCKLGRAVELADPLPQRKAAPRPPPRMLTAGVAFQISSNNAASGPRWADRPVERLRVGNGSTRQAVEEEEDPDLACYLWNRQTNRPRVERCSRSAPKWGFAC